MLYSQTPAAAIVSEPEQWAGKYIVNYDRELDLDSDLSIEEIETASQR